MISANALGLRLVEFICGGGEDLRVLLSSVC